VDVLIVGPLERFFEVEFESRESSFHSYPFRTTSHKSRSRIHELKTPRRGERRSVSDRVCGSESARSAGRSALSQYLTVIYQYQIR